MNRERLSQIRQAINHNPRGADGYVDELLRACATLLGDCDAARGDRDDTLAVLARIAEQVGVSADALVEDATLVQNRMVALMAARDEAIESARATIRHAQEQKVEAMRQRDEVRAEVERLRQGNASLSEELQRLYQRQRQGDEDWKHLRAEVEMLRGVGCGELREGSEVPDGPCGACLKCARRERDEARAERDTFKAECASISEEFGLPPTIRPAEGEIRRMLDGWKEARAEVERLRGIVEVNDRRLAAVWDEAHAEVEQLRAELRKVTR